MAKTDQSGSNNPNWKGGRKIHGRGYVQIHMPFHSRADSRGYVFEHILIAEKALGKSLPEGAAVHHANGSKDNGPLVICQDNAYHMLLEQRTRAYKACGHADWRKCCFCERYDPMGKVKQNGTSFYHPSCHAIYERNRRKKLHDTLKALH